jgi:hypothetical protein
MSIVCKPFPVMPDAPKDGAMLFFGVDPELRVKVKPACEDAAPVPVRQPQVPRLLGDVGDDAA